MDNIRDKVNAIDNRARLEAEQAKRKEEIKKRNLEEYRRFRIALDNISKTADGEIVLRHIAKISGFFQSSVVEKGGQGIKNGVDVEGTLVNEGRRGLYLDIRRPLTDEARRQIESKGEENA